MQRIIALLLTTLLAGCTVRPADSTLERARLAATPDVPIPATTPFDGDPDRRAVYREHYWAGYADGCRGIGSNVTFAYHPWNDAQDRGQQDGNRDGLNAYRVVRPGG